MIDDILSYNKQFVKDEEYKQYITSKYPDKKLAILSCMDTRLTELLPAALGIKNGDAKIIKNAGGVITHPFGSVVRSLMVAIVQLGVTDVMVVGHTDCGVQGLNADQIIDTLLKRGVEKKQIETLSYLGIDFESWLKGFDTVESSVQNSVDILKKHPLIPKDVTIRGFVMDTTTGALVEIMQQSVL